VSQAQLMRFVSQVSTGGNRNMKTFEVSFSYQDRTNGSEASTVKLDASSLPGAIAKATRLSSKA
jgi:hypothetical protein